MPNVEHTRMTSEDVFLMNNSEATIGLISECVKVIPELAQISASPITKTEYKALILKALPKVGFRQSNKGRKQEKATLATEEVKCYFLDASWSLDEKVAAECEWGEAAAQAIQAKAHMEAALQHIAIQTWYGTKADTEGFQGIASYLSVTNHDMVVNAGGATANKATSIFAIRSDIDAVQYAWGQNGQIKDGPIVYSEQYDEEMKKFWGYAQPISGHVGLQVPTLQCVGRICNITEETGKKATDRLIAQLLERFPASKKPTMLFMTQRTLGQIRDARTATNPTGAEAPYPETIFGVPIFVSEALRNDEAIVLPA